MVTGSRFLIMREATMATQPTTHVLIEADALLIRRDNWPICSRCQLPVPQFSLSDCLHCELMSLVSRHQHNDAARLLSGVAGCSPSRGSRVGGPSWLNLLPESIVPTLQTTSTYSRRKTVSSLPRRLAQLPANRWWWERVRARWFRVRLAQPLEFQPRPLSECREFLGRGAPDQTLFPRQVKIGEPLVRVLLIQQVHEAAHQVWVDPALPGASHAT